MSYEETRGLYILLIVVAPDDVGLYVVIFDFADARDNQPQDMSCFIGFRWSIINPVFTNAVDRES